MLKSFRVEDVKKSDYNFIISNLILSKIDSFTYDSILSEIRGMFGVVDNEIERVTKEALIRLTEDGFISLFVCKYTVQEVNI